MAANLNNRNIQELAETYLDGGLSPEETLRVEELLETDHNMVREVESALLTRQLLAELPVSRPSRSISSRVLQQLEEEKKGTSLMDKILELFRSNPLIPAGAAVALLVVGFVGFFGGGSDGPTPQPDVRAAVSQGSKPVSGTGSSGGAPAQGEASQDPGVVLEKIFQQSKGSKPGEAASQQSPEELAAGKTLLDILKASKASTVDAKSLQSVKFGARLGLYTKPGTQEVESLFLAFDRTGDDGGAALPKLETVAPVAGCDLPGLVKGQHGTFTLTVQVSPAGQVASVQVTQGDANQTQIALLVKAVEGWKFRPARIGTRDVGTILEMSLPSEK